MNIDVSETELVHNAIELLGALGVSCHRRNVGARTWTDKSGKPRMIKFAMPGQSDIWGVQSKVPPFGRHWEVELKRPGNRPTEQQYIWLRTMGNLGAVAFWCDSTAALESIARGVLDGGRIVWDEGLAFHVEPPDRHY